VLKLLSIAEGQFELLRGIFHILRAPPNLDKCEESLYLKLIMGRPIARDAYAEETASMKIPFQESFHKALAVIFSAISLQTGIKVNHLTVTA
jgi:hypothetical protein